MAAEEILIITIPVDELEKRISSMLKTLLDEKLAEIRALAANSSGPKTDWLSANAFRTHYHIGPDRMNEMLKAGAIETLQVGDDRWRYRMKKAAAA